MSGARLCANPINADEKGRLLARVDGLLNFLGAPGDWGYGTELGNLTQYLLRLRPQIDTKATETTTGPRPSADGFAETKSSSVSVGEVAKRALQANELEQHADRLADALQDILNEVERAVISPHAIELRARDALAAYREQQP